MTLWSSRREREAGFTEYVTAHHDHLWQIAYALTGDRHRAEDLLQTALTELYVAWPRVHAVESPDAYVRQITVRADVDESRRPWCREVPTEERADRPAPTDPGADADAPGDRLMTALAQLPPCSGAAWSCATGSTSRSRRPPPNWSPRAR